MRVLYHPIHLGRKIITMRAQYINSYVVLCFIALVLGYSAVAQTKVVLIEEGTGTWCQWCPRGMVFAHQLMEDHPGQVIPLAIHTNDEMESLNTSDYYSSTGLSALPSGNVNRVHLKEDPSDWPSRVVVELAKAVEADVILTRSYNSNTRELSVTVSAEFYTSLTNVDYRLGLIIAEDGVTGPSPGYDQSNSYAGGSFGQMGGFENLPTPVPASQMAYNHVVRDLVSDYGGDQSIIPSSPISGQTYDSTYTWTIPQEMDENYIYAVGYLVNNSNGEILNAGRSEYAVGDFNGVPFFHSADNSNGLINQSFTFDILCHDPEEGNLTISSTNLPTWLSLNDNGDGKASLSGTPNSAGIESFTLTVSDGQHSTDQVFSLTVSDEPFGWVQVGDVGFTTETARYYTSIDVNRSNNEVYVLFGYGSNDQMIVYKNTEADGWNTLGNSLTGDLFSFDIEVNQSTGEVFIATNSGSSLYVYKWENGQWAIQGGGPVSGELNDVDMEFSTSGILYLAGMNTTNSKINVYKLDGNSFVLVGGSISGTDVSIFPKIRVDNSGNPVVLWASVPTPYNYRSQVSRFDGNNWNIIGGGIIKDEFTNFEHDLAINQQDEIFVALPLTGDGILHFYKYNGNSWDLINDNVNNGGIEDISMESGSNGKIYITYKDLSSGGKTTCKVYDGTSIEYLGFPGFSPIASGQKMAIGAGNLPFVSYIDFSANDRVSVKKYENLIAPGINDITNNYRSELSIWPNPATDIIYFKINGDQIERNEMVLIYNNQGKLVLTQSFTGFVDVSAFNSGIYHVQIGYLTGRFLIAE